MNKSERAIAVKKILDKTYPETPVPLHHKDNFSLLVAVLLSAQCTDERVNEITPKLFSVASDPVSMSKVSINKIYKIMNKAERIRNVFLKTLIIESECLIKL